MAASERDKFIQRSEIPIYDGTQDYCLWMGCMGSYDPLGREIILALIEVFRYLSVSYGVLKREKCTGDPVRRLGNDYLFAELTSSNLEQIGSAGILRMITICPHCVRTIAEDWKEAGADVQIEHHSEFLARHINGLPEGSADRAKIVFHDPCYLGRYRGLYDAPRRNRTLRFGRGAGANSSARFAAELAEAEHFWEKKKEKGSASSGPKNWWDGRGGRRRSLSILQHDDPGCLNAN